jgi:hypothetical protein
MKLFEFSAYGNFSDYGWCTHCLFMQDVLGVSTPESFKKFVEFIDLGIYDSIQLKEVVILVEGPTKVSQKGGRNHCEDGPAIEFGDGYALHFWNGTKVPEKLIMAPDSITSEDILKEQNAEVRRCFREKLGAKRYYDILGGGSGVELVDEDTDNQGFPMRLYRTVMPDAIISSHVQFLEVVCPSTGRVYNIYPPNQNSTNVWDAKASTFNYVMGKYRQGDVMIVEVGKEYDTPLVET